jgi:hypothetical protein
VLFTLKPYEVPIELVLIVVLAAELAKKNRGAFVTELLPTETPVFETLAEATVVEPTTVCTAAFTTPVELVTNTPALLT